MMRYQYDDLWQAYDQVRLHNPLVQQITNYVSMDICANVTLALGASPAMVHAVEEAADFTAFSSALVINIGTLSPAWVAGMKNSAAQAHKLNKPWVLDPVGAGATAYRNQVCAELLECRPSIIRGNASEIMALAGMASSGKGVDSGNAAADALEAAQALFRLYGSVVVVSGADDYVVHGHDVVRLSNGHIWMTKVTAMGCALSAVVGAFAGTGLDLYRAAVAATAVYGVVGEMAAVHAQGPGSFRTLFLDQLANLSADQFAARLRML